MFLVVNAVVCLGVCPALLSFEPYSVQTTVLVVIDEESERSAPGLPPGVIGLQFVKG